MGKRVEYQAGAASCWIINEQDHLEYDCGPLQHRRIDKSTITAVGISDDTHLTGQVAGAATFQKLMGVQGGLCGLLIAYKEPGAQRPKLATITFDTGLAQCQALVKAVLEEFEDRYVGIDSRDGVMKKMGVSRVKENLLIAAIIVGVMLVAGALAVWR